MNRKIVYLAGILSAGLLCQDIASYDVNRYKIDQVRTIDDRERSERDESLAGMLFIDRWLIMEDIPKMAFA